MYSIQPSHGVSMDSLKAVSKFWILIVLSPKFPKDFPVWQTSPSVLFRGSLDGFTCLYSDSFT